MNLFNQAPYWSGIDPGLINANQARLGWNGPGGYPYGSGFYPGGPTAPPSNIYGPGYGYRANPIGQGVPNYTPYVSGFQPGYSFGQPSQIDLYSVESKKPNKGFNEDSNEVLGLLGAHSLGGAHKFQPEESNFNPVSSNPVESKKPHSFLSEVDDSGEYLRTIASHTLGGSHKFN